MSPVSPDVDHAQGTFEGAGGLKLFERSWRPRGPVRSVLVVMHGLKDHSSRYAGAAEKLCRQGVAVYAFDLRGHGNSDGDRVWVDKFDDYLADLDTFVARVKEKEPGKPVFVFGHSMGGAIVTLWTLEKKPAIQGLILSGPALKAGSDVSGFLIGVTKFLSGLFPSLAVMDLPNENFSRDKAVVEDMGKDPLVYQGKGPARTAAELLRAFDRIEEKMPQLTLPFLVMHGTADKLTNPEGSKLLVERAKSEDKTLKLYEGVFHDLLHEPEHDQILGELAMWIAKRS